MAKTKTTTHLAVPTAAGAVQVTPLRAAQYIQAL
jgi:hypothetical protein